MSCMLHHQAVGVTRRDSGCRGAVAAWYECATCIGEVDDSVIFTEARSKV